jgi:hypothetical protein
MAGACFSLMEAMFDSQEALRSFESGSAAPTSEVWITSGNKKGDRRKAFNHLNSHPNGHFRLLKTDAWSRGENLIGRFEVRQ